MTCFGEARNTLVTDVCILSQYDKQTLHSNYMLITTADEKTVVLTASSEIDAYFYPLPSLPLSLSLSLTPFLLCPVLLLNMVTWPTKAGGREEELLTGVKSWSLYQVEYVHCRDPALNHTQQHIKSRLYKLHMYIPVLSITRWL